jgi:hypothetical protein
LLPCLQNTETTYSRRERVYGYFLGILALIYVVAGYWASVRTIYADKILIGTMQLIFTRKLVTGFLFGWLLIPWALIRRFTGR